MVSETDLYQDLESADSIRDGEEGSRGFHLRERVFEFVVEVSNESDRLGKLGTTTDRELARQLFRSAASIGANLEEADAAQSRADFISKCNISLKEARETRYWLRLLSRRQSANDINNLLIEIGELVAILTTILKKTRENS